MTPMNQMIQAVQTPQPADDLSRWEDDGGALGLPRAQLSPEESDTQ